jgi:hypothetical protein
MRQKILKGVGFSSGSIAELKGGYHTRLEMLNLHFIKKYLGKYARSLKLIRIFASRLQDYNYYLILYYLFY